MSNNQLIEKKLVSNGISVFFLLFAGLFSLIVTLGIIVLIFFLIFVVLQFGLMVLIPNPMFEGTLDYSKLKWLNIVQFICFVIFLLLLGLIILGIVLKRYNVAFASSTSFILPIISNFTFTMFPFAGLGALAMIWLPFSHVEFIILSLGDIIFSPFFLGITFLSNEPFSDFNYLLQEYLMVYIPIGLVFFGIFLFIFSVTTWLVGKFHHKELIVFWVYKYCRHPQYLGYLLASYGMIIYSGRGVIGTGIFGVYLPPPTFFWTLSSLCLIALAIKEENHQLKRNGEKYLDYRKKTPFLIPLPLWLKHIFTIPLQSVLHSDWPTNDNQLGVFVIVYGIVIALLSLPLYFLLHAPQIL